MNSLSQFNTITLILRVKFIYQIYFLDCVNVSNVGSFLFKWILRKNLAQSKIFFSRKEIKILAIFIKFINSLDQSNANSQTLLKKALEECSDNSRRFIYPLSLSKNVYRQSEFSEKKNFKKSSNSHRKVFKIDLLQTRPKNKFLV